MLLRSSVLGEQNDFASEVVTLNAGLISMETLQLESPLGFGARQPDRGCTLLYLSRLNNSELFVNSAVV